MRKSLFDLRKEIHFRVSVRSGISSAEVSFLAQPYRAKSVLHRLQLLLV